MGINEKIITGRKFRRLIDKDSKLWQLISWWTKASDVEFDDGKTAEQKLGNINGITSDFSVDDESIAASSNLTNRAYERFDEFTDGGKINAIIIGEDGKPYIKYWDGADTVLKKLGNVDITNDNVDALLKKNGFAVDKKGSNIWSTHGITIEQGHLDNDYKFYVFNISLSGGYNVAVPEIDKENSNFGKGAILVCSGYAAGSNSFWAEATGTPNNISLRAYNYIIPPQEIGTTLKVRLRGLYSISIYGIK
ncbi:MAG: hypothetical protein K2O65_05585 [Lachnospiraceae bacterium]|nr:hypothetical protein [Lachnospiraceae bacterium]